MNYYLQDSRTYTGNDLMFWAISGKGYTSNVSLAQVYTQEEALCQHRARPTDIPWPCEYIDRKTRPAVDFQHVNVLVALLDTGITLTPMPAKEKIERYKCSGCGIFMSAGNFHSAPCHKCNTDNRP